MLNCHEIYTTMQKQILHESDDQSGAHYSPLYHSFSLTHKNAMWILVMTSVR